MSDGKPERFWPGVKEVIERSEPLQALLAGEARRQAAVQAAAVVAALLFSGKARLTVGAK